MAVQPRFLTLDAMRGVAAIAVACMHFNDWIDNRFFSSAYLAVDLFFVLSGFVISFAFDQRLNNGMSVLDFAARRFIRFWPMLLLGVAISTAKLGALISVGKTAYGFAELSLAATLNALLIPYWLDPNFKILFVTNAPAWSLLFEFVVNVIYAGLIRYLSTKALAATAIFTLLCLVALAMRGSPMSDGPFLPGAHIGALRTCFSFTVGVLLCRTQNSWDRMLPRIPSIALLLGVALLLAIPAQMHGAGFDLVFIAVLSPLLVALGSRVQPPAALTTVSTWFAQCSFPLYAINIPVHHLMPLALFRWGLPPWVLAIILLPCLVALSVWLERHFDIPVRKRLTEFATRITPALQAKSASPPKR